MQMLTIRGRRYLVHDHAAAHLNPETCPTEQSGSCPIGKPTAVFTMGSPASGKSTWISQNFSSGDWRIIDPDFYLTQHPEYDPENPAAAHYATAHLAEEEFQKALQSHHKFVLDTTGNRDKLLRRMMEAKASDFCVHLAWVCAPLEESLRRNRARSRKVNELIIVEKAHQVDETFKEARRYANVITVFDNSSHRPDMLGRNPYEVARR